MHMLPGPTRSHCISFTARQNNLALCFVESLSSLPAPAGCGELSKVCLTVSPDARMADAKLKMLQVFPLQSLYNAHVVPTVCNPYIPPIKLTTVVHLPLSGLDFLALARLQGREEW